jgi:hypothetical protein
VLALHRLRDTLRFVSTTITPAAATTAPVAAPAAAPAVTSTPAVTTPASTAPVVPATPTAEPSATPAAALDTDQTVAAMVAAAAEKGFGGEKKVEDALPVVEQPTSVDAPAAEAKVEDAVAGNATEDDEPYTLHEDGFVGAKDLAAKIEANAALKAALPEDVRNEIMANARLAEFGAGMREMFASPEEAKIVHESAQQYAGVIEAFQGVGADVQAGTTALVQKVLEMSALRNADGSPMKNEKGEYLTDGTAGKFFDTIFERKFGAAVISKVKALGDENVQAALDLVMESVGMRPSTAVQDQITDPALAARKAELDAREAGINRQNVEAKQATWKTYNDAVGGDLSGIYDGAVAKLLDGATALDSFTRGAVEKELETAIRSSLKTNTAYQMERRKIEAMGPTIERRQAENALAKRFFREHIARISKPIMDKAGVAVGKKVEARQAAQAARTESVRSEINGGAPVASAPTSGVNATQQREAVAAAMKAKTGQNPSDSDVSIQMMLEAAAAKGFR